MSMDFGSERVCYVHCNYCNTILVVNVPCNNMFTIVTVRCGHCASTITVNMGALFQSAPLQHLQHPVQKQHGFDGITTASKDSSSSSNSKCNNNNNSFATYNDRSSNTNEHHRIPPIRPPEKRQRVPSAYNRFIKEEIQRIKASNPDITHREAFSSAAKNWAHFPHIHFGTKQSN